MSVVDGKAAHAAVLSEVEAQVAAGTVNASVGDMDGELVALAKVICAAAVQSPKWKEYGEQLQQLLCQHQSWMCTDCYSLPQAAVRTTHLAPLSNSISMLVAYSNGLSIMPVLGTDSHT